MSRLSKLTFFVFIGNTLTDNIPGIKINFYGLVANWATREKKVVAQTKS